jgi:hypothetical protein
MKVKLRIVHSEPEVLLFRKRKMQHVVNDFVHTLVE